MASPPPPPPAPFTQEQLAWLSDHGGDLLGSTRVVPPTGELEDRPPGAMAGNSEEPSTRTGTGESGHVPSHMLSGPWDALPVCMLTEPSTAVVHMVGSCAFLTLSGSCELLYLAHLP